MKIQSLDLKIINSFAKILLKELNYDELKLFFKLSEINFENLTKGHIDDILKKEEFNQQVNEILLFLIKNTKINLIKEIINKVKYLLSKENKYYSIEIKSKIELSEEDKNSIIESIIKKLDIKEKLYQFKFETKDKEVLVINEMEYNLCIIKKLENIFQSI